jgi:hypothetical protein
MGKITEYITLHQNNPTKPIKEETVTSRTSLRLLWKKLG